MKRAAGGQVQAFRGWMLGDDEITIGCESIPLLLSAAATRDSRGHSPADPMFRHLPLVARLSVEGAFCLLYVLLERARHFPLSVVRLLRRRRDVPARRHRLGISEDGRSPPFDFFVFGGRQTAKKWACFDVQLSFNTSLLSNNVPVSAGYP